MSSTVQTEQTAAWPEGVIARYITLGGGTVDLTTSGSSTSIATLSSCTGCQANNESPHWVGVWRDLHQPDAADRTARAWAQSHAETCRAIPRLT